jgi:alkaline phosphatase
MINSGFDYFGGGGVISPDDKKNPEYQGNIYEIMEKAGYKVAKVKNQEELGAFKAGCGKVYLRGSDGSLPYAIDNQGQSLKLADFVRKGIELLDNEKGFFIMCEGGAIDWMGHGNDAATNILETIDLDQAVKVAYDFAQQHPEETLIVITGDHETGGLTLGFANTGYEAHLEKLFMQKQSSPHFSGYLKKAAKGKEQVVLDDLKPAITEFYGLTFAADAKPVKAPWWRRMFGLGPKKSAPDPMSVTAEEEAKLADVLAKKQLKGNDFFFAVLHLFNSKVGISWSSLGHSALPTITSAWGKGAERFGGGEYENTNIAIQLKALLHDQAAPAKQ